MLCSGKQGIGVRPTHFHSRAFSARSRTSGPQRGLTMIEVLVTVTLIAILASIATPSFTSIIRNGRILGEANSFVGDLQLARAEAIKRGLPVILCPSSDGQTCLTGANANNWQVGWIMIADNDSSLSQTAGDTVIHVRNGWGGTDTFQAIPGATQVTYNREGFAVNLPAGGLVTFAARSTPVVASATRCVALNMVGRQTMQQSGTGACP